MRYMQKDPNPSGAYPGIQTINFAPDGWLPLAADCDDAAMITHKGYVNRTVSDGVVTSITGDDVTYQEWQLQETKKQENINKQNEIDSLKIQLTNTDYKIIKCSEANLVSEDTPYDIATLHNERQAIRDRINQLESELEEK